MKRFIKIALFAAFVPTIHAWSDHADAQNAWEQCTYENSLSEESSVGNTTDTQGAVSEELTDDPAAEAQCIPEPMEGARFFAIQMSEKDLRQLVRFSPYVAQVIQGFRDKATGVYPMDLRSGDVVLSKEPTTKTVMGKFKGESNKSIDSHYVALPTDAVAVSTWKHTQLADGTEGLIVATIIKARSGELISAPHQPVLVRLEKVEGQTRPVPQFAGVMASLYRFAGADWVESL